MNYCYQAQNQSLVQHSYQEYVDSYNFSPFQNHVKPISRPSHIPMLTTQPNYYSHTSPIVSTIRTHQPFNKQNHHTYQFSKTKSVISTQQKFYKLQVTLQHQANKPPKNSQPYLCRSQLQSPHTPSRQEKHLFYQHHLH